jgi:type IV secretion system protein VirB9
MRRSRQTLLGAMILIAGMSSCPAWAEEDPTPGHADARMRVIPYSADQVFHLSTAVGATLVVGFAEDETVTQVAVTDSKDLKASPAKNFLFFKSAAALSLQPVIVLTTNPGGQLRRYVFEVTTVDAKSLAADAPGVYYSVQFTYPQDEAEKRRETALANARKAAAAAEARAARAQLALAHETLEQQARNPFSGPRNWRYVAQGDRSLLPLEVFDNGFSTVFRFPGNVRVPSLFVINPDGKEATANYAVKGDLVQTESVARQWRLRDGDTVLCIFNRGYDPVGENPQTGTTSPNVQRVTKGSPP